MKKISYSSNKAMKKLFIILSIVAVVAMSLGSSAYAQSGDLCGDTGGNGEIVNVGSNTFTLMLNDNGEKGGGSLIVNLTSQATIETSAGFVSLSDLKIGERVTLVGDNHRDGTFTADAVVVCSGTQEARAQENGTDQTTSIIVRNENSKEYEKVSGVINSATLLIVGLIWLSIAVFLKLKRKKSSVYLLFFTLFYIYLYKVLDYTLLQFQSLLLLQHFVPNLILNGFKDGTNANLVPLATLTMEDAKTSLLNILMMMPFGFGLPFITNLRIKKVTIAGLLLSIIIELLQLITGFMANTTFRVADINDLIFNTTGVAMGYILFIGFIHMFRYVSHNWKNPILRFIADRPQIEK